jgi:hypothetical protein
MWQALRKEQRGREFDCCYWCLQAGLLVVLSSAGQESHNHSKMVTCKNLTDQEVHSRQVYCVDFLEVISFVQFNPRYQQHSADGDGRRCRTTVQTL